MAHPRTEIREAAVQALKDAPTSAGDAVFDSTRTTVPKSGEMPQLYVYTPGESITDESAQTHPRELDRRLRLLVEGWQRAGEFDTVASALDTLALEVEGILNGHPSLGQTANDTVLVDTTITLDPTGDNTCGFFVLEFLAVYQTTVKSQAVDDFLRAPTDYRVNGVGPDDDATDAITLPGPTP